VKPGVNLWSRVLIYNRPTRQRDRERDRERGGGEKDNKFEVRW